MNNELKVGSRVVCLGGIERFALSRGPGGTKGNRVVLSSRGTILSLYTIPMNNVEGIPYADVEWDDGTKTGFPLTNLRPEPPKDGKPAHEFCI